MQSRKISDRVKSFDRTRMEKASRTRRFKPRRTRSCSQVSLSLFSDQTFKSQLQARTSVTERGCTERSDLGLWKSKSVDLQWVRGRGGHPSVHLSTWSPAGHDTTASAICWSLYNLAQHDRYQEQCRKEVMELMEGRDVHEIKW